MEPGAGIIASVSGRKALKIILTAPVRGCTGTNEMFQDAGKCRTGNSACCIGACLERTWQDSLFTG